MSAADTNTARSDFNYRGIPKKSGSAAFRDFDQTRMQFATTDSQASAIRKIGLRLFVLIDETNSTKFTAIAILKFHAEFAKEANCSGHQALAASFFDWELTAVRDDYF